MVWSARMLLRTTPTSSPCTHQVPTTVSPPTSHQQHQRRVLNYLFRLYVFSLRARLVRLLENAVLVQLLKNLCPGTCPRSNLTPRRWRHHVASHLAPWLQSGEYWILAGGLYSRTPRRHVQARPQQVARGRLPSCPSTWETKSERAFLPTLN